MASSSKISKAGCRGIWLPNTAASRLTDESIKWEERKPLGVRFIPTDKVLAETFLCGKVFGLTDSPVFKFFRDKEVYECEPSDLSYLAHAFGEGKMYFFATLKPKYPDAGRKRSVKTVFKRETPGGFWQKTGRDSSFEVMFNDVLKPMVTKASLAFHKKDKNSGKQEETPWRMKEYMLDMKSYEKAEMQDPLVLCVVYNKNNDYQASSSFVPPTQNDRKRRRLVVPEISENENLSSCSNPPLYPATASSNSTNFGKDTYPSPVMSMNSNWPSHSGDEMPLEVIDNDMNISINDQNIESYTQALQSFHKEYPASYHPSFEVDPKHRRSSSKKFCPTEEQPEGRCPDDEMQTYIKDIDVCGFEPQVHYKQFVPPGGGMMVILPTASVSAASNDMSFFHGLSVPYPQSEAPLQQPPSDGQRSQHLVQPSHPIDLTECDMSDQNDNGLHPFSLPRSELEATQTRATNVPPCVGIDALFSAWYDLDPVNNPLWDIYWENTPAVLDLYQNSMAEQPLSEQLQHQQLQQLDIFSPDARLNESVIEQEPFQNVINQPLLANSPAADSEHVLTPHLQQQRQIQRQHQPLGQESDAIVTIRSPFCHPSLGR